MAYKRSNRRGKRFRKRSRSRRRSRSTRSRSRKRVSFAKNRAKLARKIRSIAVKAVNGQHNAVHKHIKEIRGGHVDIPEDRIQWNALCDFGAASTGDFPVKGAIEATDAVNGAVGDADDVFSRFKINKARSVYHIRNLSIHPMMVTLYELTPRVHIEFLASGAATLKQHVIDMLDNGWKELMGAGAAGVTSASGDAAVVDSATSIEVTSSYLAPSDSRYFKEYYKVLKKKTFKLNAGDDVFWRVSQFNLDFIPRFYLPVTDNALDGTERNKEGIKNYSRVLLMKVNGCLGHGTGANQSSTGYLTGDFATECTYRCEVQAIPQDTKAGINLSTAYDDLTAITLEGPTEHLMTDQD